MAPAAVVVSHVVGAGHAPPLASVPLLVDASLVPPSSELASASMPGLPPPASPPLHIATHKPSRPVFWVAKPGVVAVSDVGSKAWQANPDGHASLVRPTWQDWVHSPGADADVLLGLMRHEQAPPALLSAAVQACPTLLVGVDVVVRQTP